MRNSKWVHLSPIFGWITKIFELPPPIGLLENLGLISLSFRWIIEEFMDFIKWSYFDLFLSKNCFCKNYSGSVSYPLPVTQYPFLNLPRQATERCTRRWTGNSDHRRWWDVASPCLRENSDEVHNNNLHSPSLTWNLKMMLSNRNLLDSSCWFSRWTMFNFRGRDGRNSHPQKPLECWFFVI